MTCVNSNEESRPANRVRGRRRPEYDLEGFYSLMSFPDYLAAHAAGDALANAEDPLRVDAPLRGDGCADPPLHRAGGGGLRRVRAGRERPAVQSRAGHRASRAVARREGWTVPLAGGDARGLAHDGGSLTVVAGRTVKYLRMQHRRMAESETDDPETTTINIRLTESFLEDIDVTWKEEGFNSRSEFIRDAVRDAVKHPGLTRGAWKDIAATEFERRRGEATVFSREDVIED